MDLKLNINAEEVAAELSRILVSDSLKALLLNAVDEEIKRLNSCSGGWNSNSIITNVVQAFIRRKLEEILNTEYNDIIQEDIRKYLNETTKLKEYTSVVLAKLEFRSSSY